MSELLGLHYKGLISDWSCDNGQYLNSFKKLAIYVNILIFSSFWSVKNGFNSYVTNLFSTAVPSAIYQELRISPELRPLIDATIRLDALGMPIKHWNGPNTVYYRTIEGVKFFPHYVNFCCLCIDEAYFWINSASELDSIRS